MTEVGSNTDRKNTDAAPCASTLVQDRSLETVCATSPEQVEFLREDWLLICARHARASLYANPDLFLATIAHESNSCEPYVVVFRRGGTPCALIVGQTGKRRLLCRLGYVKLHTPEIACLDILYGGLVTDGDLSTTQAVLGHLRALLRNSHTGLVIIHYLPVSHELFAQLRDGIGFPSPAVLARVSPHWRLCLTPGSYEDTIKGFSKKHRYNMRRTNRLLLEHFNHDVALRTFTQIEQLDEFGRGATSIAAKTYQAGLGVGFSNTSLWRTVLRTHALKGRLRCYWLECKGSPIAFQIGVVYGKMYVLVATGYLPKYKDLSPGTVMLLRVLQDLCQAHIEEVDYGFGDADYKRIYGTYAQDEATLRLYAGSGRPRMARTLNVSAIVLSRSMVRMLRLFGWHNTLKRMWRHRLERTQ